MSQTNAGHAEPAARRRRRWRWSAAEKAGYLEQLATSGLTLEAFCREHGLSRTVVGRWRRAARAAGPRASRGSSFAAVTLRPAATVSLAHRGQAVGLTMVVRWPSGVSAELSGLDGASVGAVVTMLGSLADDRR